MSEYRYYRNCRWEAHISVPVLQPLDKWSGRRRMYSLVEPFSVKIYYPGGRWTVTVPAGYETDLASIPLFAQLILGGRDDFLEESLVHDWLYGENAIPSFFGDSMLRSLMEVLGRPKWKILLVFYGLMCFGHRAPLWAWILNLWKKTDDGTN